MIKKHEIIDYFKSEINSGKRLVISEHWFSKHFQDAYSDFCTWKFIQSMTFQQKLYHYLYIN